MAPSTIIGVASGSDPIAPIATKARIRLSVLNAFPREVRRHIRPPAGTICGSESTVFTRVASAFLAAIFLGPRLDVVAKHAQGEIDAVAARDCVA